MERSRLLTIVLFAFGAAGLMAYALTYRPPLPTTPNSIFAYDQRTFLATRKVTTPRFPLHLIVFTSDGGNVETDWYDSSLALLAPESGVYVTLLIDQTPVADVLTGSYFG